MVVFGPKFPFVIYRDNEGNDHTAVVVDITDVVTGNVTLYSFARNQGEADKCVGVDGQTQNLVLPLPGVYRNDIPVDPGNAVPEIRHWRPMPASV
ncbi:MAG: hypothetical protein E6R03_01620 [Hyphomicrobiaceae bacterium]|nr:MAG: hypothetical protein E6R03_01620 [Hyphomicrobiaceae bacterium]